MRARLLMPLFAVLALSGVACSSASQGTTAGAPVGSGSSPSNRPTSLFDLAPTLLDQANLFPLAVPDRGSLARFSVFLSSDPADQSQALWYFVPTSGVTPDQLSLDLNDGLAKAAGVQISSDDSQYTVGGVTYNAGPGGITQDPTPSGALLMAALDAATFNEMSFATTFAAAIPLQFGMQIDRLVLFVPFQEGLESADFSWAGGEQDDMTAVSTYYADPTRYEPATGVTFKSAEPREDGLLVRLELDGHPFNFGISSCAASLTADDLEDSFWACTKEAAVSS